MDLELRLSSSVGGNVASFFTVVSNLVASLAIMVIPQAWLDRWSSLLGTKVELILHNGACKINAPVDRTDGKVALSVDSRSLIGEITDQNVMLLRIFSYFGFSSFDLKLFYMLNYEVGPSFGETLAREQFHGPNPQRSFPISYGWRRRCPAYLRFFNSLGSSIPLSKEVSKDSFKVWITGKPRQRQTLSKTLTVLVDDDGVKEEVVFKYFARRTDFLKDEAIFCKGWTKFYDKHNLKQGMTCIFSLHDIWKYGNGEDHRGNSSTEESSVESRGLFLTRNAKAVRSLFIIV